MVCWKTLAFLLLWERAEKQRRSILKFRTTYIIMQFSNRCWKVGHYTRLTDWLLESLVWKLFHLYSVYLRRFFFYIFAICTCLFSSFLHITTWYRRQFYTVAGFFSDQTLFFTTTLGLWANYRPTWNNSIMCKPWNPINHFLDQKISAKVKHLSQADCVSVPREEPLG